MSTAGYAYLLHLFLNEPHTPTEKQAMRSVSLEKDAKSAKVKKEIYFTIFS